MDCPVIDLVTTRQTCTQIKTTTFTNITINQVGVQKSIKNKLKYELKLYILIFCVYYCVLIE